jgi:hypothetical protein
MQASPFDLRGPDSPSLLGRRLGSCLFDEAQRCTNYFLAFPFGKTGIEARRRYFRDALGQAGYVLSADEKLPDGRVLLGFEKGGAEPAAFVLLQPDDVADTCESLPQEKCADVLSVPR